MFTHFLRSFSSFPATGVVTFHPLMRIFGEGSIIRHPPPFFKVEIILHTSIPLFRPRQSTVALRAEMTIFLLLFVKEIIIIIIMNGSCIAPILPSRKLNVLTHTIHANIHTDRHKHNLPLPPPTHTHTSWST